MGLGWWLLGGWEEAVQSCGGGDGPEGWAGTSHAVCDHVVPAVGVGCEQWGPSQQGLERRKTLFSAEKGFSVVLGQVETGLMVSRTTGPILHGSDGTFFNTRGSTWPDRLAAGVAAGDEREDRSCRAGGCLLPAPWMGLSGSVEAACVLSVPQGGLGGCLRCFILSLEQCFSAGGDFCVPQGTRCIWRHVCYVSGLGPAVGTSWVEPTLLQSPERPHHSGSSGSGVRSVQVEEDGVQLHRLLCLLDIWVISGFSCYRRCWCGL